MGKEKDLTKEQLYQYYIIENHSIEECTEKFNMSKSGIKGRLKKYNIHKSKELILQQREQTCMDKYGVKHALQNPDSVEKFKTTYKNRTDDQNKQTIQQREQTCMDKYGVKNPLQYNNFKEKAKETNLNKYGCEYVMQNKDVYNKSKNTLLQKYGVTNVSQIKEVQEKRLQTMQVRFGVNNYGELTLTEEQRDLLNDKEKFLKFIQDNNLCHTVDIANAINCSPTAILSRIRTYDIRFIIDNSQSRYESEISSFLDNLNIKHEKTRTILDGKEIDLYCPDYNIGIEFNGNYWHSTVKHDKQYHFNKSKLAESKGIRLIHIWEYEWTNEKLRPILESLLKISFNQTATRIYARNCEIREIDNKEAKPFNDLNHLQGHRDAQVTYGLFYNNELVQLMSFSKTKYNKNLKNDNSWEIIRGCPGSNNIVVGGVSKLFTHFVRQYNPEYIFSYCDYNKFDGKGYEAIGMKFIGFTGPDMKWLMPDYTVVNRSPVKHKELKEKAIAQIWGSGSKKYLWTNPEKNKLTT